MNRDAYTVIKRPLITEKSMDATSMSKYVFEVDIKANKVEIAKAIEEMFSVDVKKVNTLRVKGKAKRVNSRVPGKTADRKKAYVTLKEGQSIEIFENA